MLARSHAGPRDGAVWAEQMSPAPGEDKAPSHVEMVREIFSLKKTPQNTEIMPVMLKAFSYTSLQVKIKFYKNSKPSNEKILLSKGRRLRNFEQFSNHLHTDIDFLWKIHK